MSLAVCAPGGHHGCVSTPTKGRADEPPTVAARLFAAADSAIAAAVNKRVAREDASMAGAGGRVVRTDGVSTHSTRASLRVRVLPIYAFSAQARAWRRLFRRGQKKKKRNDMTRGAAGAAGGSDPRPSRGRVPLPDRGRQGGRSPPRRRGAFRRCAVRRPRTGRCWARRRATGPRERSCASAGGRTLVSLAFRARGRVLGANSHIST